MNHETDLLPLTYKSFLEKLTLIFVNVCILTSKQPIFEFFEQFKMKMTVLEIYFLGLENVKKN